MYIRGGQFVLMQKTTDAFTGREFFVATYDNGAAVDTLEEAQDQRRECIAEDDAANPNTYKIFKITEVEEY